MNSGVGPKNERKAKVVSDATNVVFYRGIVVVSPWTCTAIYAVRR